MHEIVTLQFGRQSNYLATHFWNTQESYFTYSAQVESPVNHDIHFRPGIAPDGSDTFTPRTVIYDLKNEFGTLRKINELYEFFPEQQTQHGVWRGSTITQHQPAVQPNEYQQHLNEGVQPPALTKERVRYWSDFNRVFYHPRSIVQIYETDLDPERRAFDDWRSGEELFHALDAEHDLLDRDLRPFVEECDQMQGLYFLTSVEDGWGGFSARYLDRLRDEFGKLPMWIFASGQNSQAVKARQPRRLLNEAHALREISPQASTYVPVSAVPQRLPRYVDLDENSAWMTSALQSTALETITLPSRLQSNQRHGSALMDDLSTFLNLEGNKNIAQLNFSVVDDADVPREDGARCSLFENDVEATKTFAELEVLRGSHVEAYLQQDTNGHSHQDVDSLRRLHSSLAFPILDSFPQMYHFRRPAERAASVRARLSVSSSASEWIKELERIARPRIAPEERENFLSDLQDIRQHYEVEAGSSEEWDD